MAIRKKTPKTIGIIIEREDKALITSFSEKFTQGVSQRIQATEEEKEVLSGLVGACSPKITLKCGISYDVGDIAPDMPIEAAQKLLSLFKKFDPATIAAMQLSERERNCIEELKVALS